MLAADNPRFDRDTFVAACADGNVGRRPRRKPHVFPVDSRPLCVKAMRCYCAGHARGNPASEPCDTREAELAMPEYNGHHCWNCWNVALWIGNDEALYRAALECKRRPSGTSGGGAPSLRLAAHRMLDMLPARTPDGARYTFKAVRAALAGLE